MSAQDQYAAHNVISALAAERDGAEARAKALQGVIERCVAHVRRGQQLGPDEPDAGLEALVVGWVNYHGDCCNFKARAGRAEARVVHLQRVIEVAASHVYRQQSDAAYSLLRDSALAAGLSLQEE